MQQNSASNPFAMATYVERPQMGLDVEFGADPASGAAFFQSDGRKHDDLKQMLDSNKDGLKLEAMKRIIGMIARGRDASDLFPAVVKNVVSKNIEVKKLVYVYLVRYAEEQQDLALLSISTFQRALKDPNQLIRASALRVLSSIRVSMIVPIVMLAIRDSAADLSAYVRKTAAHAIPKLYSLDPDQKDELVTVIEKLLSDRTTLVVGSAVMAFDEVCPERVDLIHKNYRKLCNLLVDVDEWGQVIIINMLTRYARTQFVDPNADDDLADGANETPTNERFYDESSHESDHDSASSASGSQSSDDEDADSKAKRKESKANNVTSNNGGSRTPSSPGNSYHIDVDHRLLLRQTKPLLQSRNASVVMAVAQLYHHVAPKNEVQLIAKALIRLLRSHKEVQSVVLNCIASMSTKRKAIFEPHLKSFFVRTSDPTHLKLLKLDILTNLASAGSISLILREFQTYISSSDRSFVAATIQAIGRCASSIKEVTETCLSGLVHLLSNHDGMSLVFFPKKSSIIDALLPCFAEHVVAESVVVIKRLLQTNAAEHFEIITQMAKLIDYINVPAARAAIIWLIGEYNEKVPLIAPDVLRKMAKSFVDEQDVVKLQVLNLGVKLYLTNPQQTSLLCQYVFTLARYDPNYDVRDRARFLRQIIFPASGASTVLTQHARHVFLASKPAPLPESKYRDGNNFQLGSLSHYLNMPATGYKELPSFPAIAPDTSVRNIAGFMQEKLPGEESPAGRSKSAAGTADGKDKSAGGEKGFLSESEDKSSAYSESGSSSSSSGTSDSESDSEDSGSSGDEQAEQAGQTKQTEQKPQAAKVSAEKSTGDLIDAGGNEPMATPAKINNSAGASGSGESSAYSGSSSSSSSDDSGSGSDNDEPLQAKGEQTTPKAEPKQPSKSNLDLLLDLDDIPPMGPVMTPSLGGFLTPGLTNRVFCLGTGTPLQPQNASNRVELVGPSHTDFEYKELLNKVSGHGLQLGYHFTRAPHLFSSSMCSIKLQFQNRGDKEITGIHLGQTTGLPAGMQLNEFPPVVSLQPQQTASGILGVDFNDSTHAVDLELVSSAGSSRVQLKPPVGELVRAVQIGESCHREERAKLRGMNEHQCELRGLRKDLNNVPLLLQKVCECINVALTYCSPSEQVYCFAGQTLSSKSLVLLTLQLQTEGALTLLVNCEKMVIGSMVLNELRNALQQSLAM
ncbi:hypothetical protein KR018_005871 [Drosophila ironensis]|nr:hypothetical protein KR018_005871 [Drosophila ironensis]